jgi:hypothetical protein
LDSDLALRRERSRVLKFGNRVAVGRDSFGEAQNLNDVH